MGISKKTLYIHVENKNDLVSKVLDFTLQEKNCAIDKIFDKRLNAIEELLEVGIHIVKTTREYNLSVEYDLKKYYPELYHRMHTIRKDRMYEAVLENIHK